MDKENGIDQEFAAMRAMLDALEPLTEQAQDRVCRYVAERVQAARYGEQIAARGSLNPSFYGDGLTGQVSRR